MNEVNKILKEVELITGSDFAPAIPITPVAAIARLIKSPVTVFEVVKLDSTAPFVWVRYEPYRNRDPWALVPTIDFDNRFWLIYGRFIERIVGWRQERNFNRFYKNGMLAIDYIKRHLDTVSDLTDDETEWFIDILRNWLSDPANILNLVEQTKYIAITVPVKESIQVKEQSITELKPPTQKKNMSTLMSFFDSFNY